MVVYKFNVTLNPQKTNKDNPKLFEQIQWPINQFCNQSHLTWFE